MGNILLESWLLLAFICFWFSSFGPYKPYSIPIFFPSCIVRQTSIAMHPFFPIQQDRNPPLCHNLLEEKEEEEVTHLKPFHPSTP